MKLEHCFLEGCNTNFTTNNFNLVTTPRHEWRLVLGEETPNCEDQQFVRRIPSYMQLGDLEVVKTASLTPAEIIAVILYTGPMVSTPSARRVILIRLR